MPYYRKTICLFAGCKNYATHGAYCEKHKHEANRDTTSKHVRLYKLPRWESARKSFLIDRIWCEECLKNDIYTPANTVHHSHGFVDYNSFFDKRWWVALCASCHSKIHSQLTNEDLWNKFGGG